MVERRSSLENQPTHPAVTKLIEAAEQYVSPAYLKKSRNPWGPREDEAGLEFKPELYDTADPYNHKYDGKVWVPKGNPDAVIPDALDFNNLKFISKEKAKEALEHLEELARNLKPDEKVSLVIGTGGTIAMTLQNGKLVPKLDTDAILEFAGQRLKNQFRLAGLEFPKAMDSSQMCSDFTMDIVVAISAIWNQASDNLKKHFTGFLVTHGTDTLAWSAADMSMALGPNPPFSVAFVGAQQTTEATFSDVATNVAFSLKSLVQITEKDLNTVMIGIGGTAGAAYSGLGAIKVSDVDAKAFNTPGHKELINWSDFGKSGTSNKFFQASPVKKKESPFKPLVFTGPRPFFRVSPDQGTNASSEYKRVLSSPEPVVILESFGTGTAHRDIVDAVMSASEETGKIVFLASPLAVGSLDHKYADALYAVEKGAIPVEMMPAALAAKIHLAVTMFGTKDRSRLIDFVKNRNYAGEQFAEWEPKKGGIPSGKTYFRVGAPRGFHDTAWEGKMEQVV